MATVTKSKKKPGKKVISEPVVKEQEWEAVIAYLEWWRNLDPALKGAATHNDKLKILRNG